MDNGIFGRLSVESHEEKVVAEEFTVVDAISTEEAYADAIVIANEAAVDAGAMDKAVVAAERLEVQVSNEEAILANPESVTAGVVLLSQESLKTTAMLLGADDSMISAYQVSNEAAVDNPVSAMQVSNEGVKDFLKKLYEGIKLLFKKIGNAMKKLYTKLVVVMNGTAKAATTLKKQISDSKVKEPASAKFEEAKAKSLMKKFGGAAHNAGATTITPAVITGLMDSKTSTEIDDAIKFLGALADSANKTKEEDAKGEYDKIIKTLAGDDAAIKNLEDNFGYTKPDGLVGINVVIVNGSSCKIVEVKLKEAAGTEASDYADALKSISYGVVSLKADVSDIADKDVAVLKLAELISLCAAVETSAKGLKGFAAARDKDLKTLEKEIDTAAKDADGSAFVAKMKGNVMNGSRAMGAGVLLGSVLAYVANNKAALSFVKDNFAEYKASAEV